MKKRIKRGVVWLAAAVCLIIGAAGLVLPIIPGLLLIAMALVLGSMLSRRVRAWLDRHTRAFPKLHAAVRDIEEWVARLVGEL